MNHWHVGHVATGDQRTPPPGGLPWDSANSFRIGAMSGSILGALVALLTSVISGWFVAAGAAIGGIVGYWYHRREEQRRGNR